MKKVQYNPPRYLNPGDMGSFRGFRLLDPKQSYLKNPVTCPLCRGFGGWNLKLNAYGDNKHFKAHCIQCNGYGYVESGSKSESCIHSYKELTAKECSEIGISHYGNCYHVNKCVTCGDIRAVDSSD